MADCRSKDASSSQQLTILNLVVFVQAMADQIPIYKVRRVVYGDTRKVLEARRNKEIVITDTNGRWVGINASDDRISE